jgi:transposase
MTIWSIRDLQALLARERGVVVSVDTVHRTVHHLGFRSRRPRHDPFASAGSGGGGSSQARAGLAAKNSC